MALSISHFTSCKILPRLSRDNLYRLSSSSSSITMKSAVSDKQSYWTDINADVKTYLEHSLPIRAPVVVHQPMHDLVFAAPKTMASALCIAAYELVGGQRSEAVVAAACAINLVHAASHTHAHLPNLLERTTPSAYGANIELLTGDAISPLGFELLARSDVEGGNSERILRVIIEIARAMGGQGVVHGRYMHVKWAKGQKGEDGVDVIQEVCKKEAALYACGAACGAILGGASEEEVEKLRTYGLYIGMIWGMMYGAGREESDRLKIAKGLAPLALEELEGFDGEKVSEFSSLVGVWLGLSE
ncbi:heterodimeric geranylgeranyl pyrophosphate synthase small subunit, chloroplastic-like [Magnolia sinica]|uniref:heterodimeric geranylgeranyl pyrophosphate synthase small subunit, chloroplastic-like n=1 Tax=Magnolia sinica TaxID=86752 RepID=UPI0026587D98|nr:heterodimeric geranylgeranyl pyrophosphate synthase small subunit, chloroplastic-like [Magnolia sinica]